MSIDLGKKDETGSCPCPCGTEKGKSEVRYPTLYLDSEKSDLKELPESGTMTVQFKRVSWEERKTEKETRYSCVLEVQKILDVKDAAPEAPATKKGATATSEALDMLAEALTKKKSEQSDDSDEGY